MSFSMVVRLATDNFAYFMIVSLTWGFLFKTRINMDLNEYAKFLHIALPGLGHQPSLTKHNGKEEKE